MSTTLSARSGPSQPAGSEPYPVLLRLSLAFGLSAGFGLGLLLLLVPALRLPLTLAWSPLVQVHGQVQALGFTALFVIGVASVLFPRFLASPLRRPGRVVLGGWLLAGGVALRAVAQPFDLGSVRAAALVLAGTLALAGFLLVLLTLLEAARASLQPRGFWQGFVALGLGSLRVGLVLNLIASLWLAAGELLVPAPLDEALIHLELFGFVVPVALAVGLRVFPQFLILQPPHPRLFAPTLAGFAAGLVLVTVGWLLSAGVPEAALALRTLGFGLELAALLAFVYAINLYRAPTRESGMPHITNPTRRWIRLAFAFLIAALALQTALSLRQLVGGQPPTFTELSAARHAHTMGFLVVLIAAMAVRILPGYSAFMVKRGVLAEAIVDLLLAGAALRVVGELLGGYGALGAPVVALGGALGALGFTVFAVLLWATLPGR